MPTQATVSRTALAWGITSLGLGLAAALAASCGRELEPQVRSSGSTGPGVTASSATGTGGAITSSSSGPGSSSTAGGGNPLPCGVGKTTFCALGTACGDTDDCVAGQCAKGVCVPPVVGVWEPITTKGVTPSPRAYPSMVWDKDLKRSVVYGGENLSPSGSPLDRMLSFDGTTSTWTDLTTAATNPGNRSSPMLVFDTGTSDLVLFGGCDPESNDTWTYKTQTWDHIQFPAVNAPSKRCASAAVFFPPSGVTVLFGGRDDSYVYSGGTWVWDDSKEKWSAADPDAGAIPPDRGVSAMVFDSAHGVAVMHGGVNALGIVDDTWSWDGATWKDVSPPSRPMLRFAHAMAYDSIRDRTVLFGGYSQDNQARGDTWEWDSTSKTWARTLPEDPKNPSPRFLASMSFDPTIGRILLFGGADAMSNCSNDTWEYHAIANACSKGADCDTGHCVDGLCCEVASCGACEACNVPSDPGHCAPDPTNTSPQCTCGDAGADAAKSCDGG